MFERFTPEARDLVVRAQEHARRLRHGWVGCEHLLLAAASSSTPAGAGLRDGGAHPQALEHALAAVIGPGPGGGDDRSALASLGIDLDQVREAVEATFGSGALDATRTGRRRRLRRPFARRRPPCPTARNALPLTPKAKRCLELALREALRRRDGHIGVEHVALALLARDDTAAWAVLLHAGAVPGELRRAVEAAAAGEG